MSEYPEDLLPRRAYPILSNNLVAQYNFIRETEEAIYNLLDKDLHPKDIGLVQQLG
jgi:hypothetical protein